MKKYQVVKRYGHEEGLSCCFRQWKAPETHCKFLHGYALAFELTFECNTLDMRDWVISFGELKEIKQFIKDSFDHVLALDINDPELEAFSKLNESSKLAQLKTFPDGVGCENFAKYVYDFSNQWLADWNLNSNRDVKLVSVKCQEHAGNSVLYHGE